MLKGTGGVGMVVLTMIALLQVSDSLSYRLFPYNYFPFPSNLSGMLTSSQKLISLRLKCLLVFVAGKPHSIGSSERIQLSGMYNVRKGKMQLPVNRWTRRQVILCGTCLIVSSVKDSLTGKMHVLPLIGGKVSLKQTKC